MSQVNTEALDRMFESHSSTIGRDLKLNLKRILEDGQLSPDESLMTLLATATSVHHAPLAQYARDQLALAGISSEIVQEAAESAAIMGMLNIYYRFRSMVAKDDDYRSAALRMTGLARPAMGKEKFEMLALAVSCINGCHTCVKSHEQVLRDAGVTADKIHDLVRIAAVVKGLESLSHTQI